MLMAGRGAGKTRSGAEYTKWMVEHGGARHIALVARTAADVRDVVVEGESGLLSVYPPNDRPRYEPSKRRITFKNGAIATTFSADEPDALRGPQSDFAWADELAAWRYPEAWDNLMMGHRLGAHPRCVVTTTPKPVPLVRDILKSPDAVVTKATTYANLANLAPSFINFIVGKYEGTRLGRQELNAELLEDTPGALWTRGRIEALRVTELPEIVRIVVAIDPSTTSKEESAETGIIVAALGANGHGYVLDDVSLRDTPDAWGRQAVAAYNKHRADRIYGEANNGGDMIETVIRTIDPKVAYQAVHASRGKDTRAEPVSALYEQGKVHHLGQFAELEDQLCTWVPGQAKSPDRLDALVWALTALMLTDTGGGAKQIRATGIYGSGRGRR